MKPYNPKVIEPKWQKIWEDTKLYEAKDNAKQPKYYALEFFPYPSGATLHVGHVRNYTINDGWARFQRMRGYNVLHPMGWDAFGLPAENYAIKNNVTPRKSTDANIKVFKRQFKQMGFSYDWSREIDSSRSDYYKWTQWLFLLFYKKGLAYRKKALVNWCPHDKTVLANEQVVGEKNVCERCGTPVMQKELEQWFFKITNYADRLLADLDDLDWPESIKTMQRNWIGKSSGALIEFRVDGSKEKFEVFTTRQDTQYGVTFLVLAPEHPLVKIITSAEQKAKVQKYVVASVRKTQLDRMEAVKDKTGVFTGAYAINPINKEKIPIWTADYVLMSYGSGAVMGVPGHDQRDFEFATKFHLPIRHVIEPVTGQKQTNPEFRKSVVAIVEDPKTGKFLSINWGPARGGNLFIGGGLDKNEDPLQCAKREVAEETGYTDIELVAESEKVHHHYFAVSKNKPRKIEALGFYFKLTGSRRLKPKLEKDEAGKFKVEWLSAEHVERLVGDELHQYIFQKLVRGNVYSREGVIVNSGKYNGMDSGAMREQILKDMVKLKIAKEQTNYRLRDWLISRQRYWGAPIPIIHCDKDGIIPVPEEDLPVVLPENVKFKPTGQSPLLDIPKFVNTKCPKCGKAARRETDTMDTFVDSSWYYLRFADPHNNKQPFDPKKANYWMPVDMYVGGAEHAVMHLLYARFWTKVLHDSGLVSRPEPFKALRNQGLIGGADGRKMGKRYNNSVTPDEIIESGYGADALRAYELFIAPFDQGVPWDPQGIVGTRRFLDRVWTLVRQYQREAKRKAQPVDNQAEQTTKLEAITHKTIRRITRDIEAFSFNTAVAGLMELVNNFYKLKAELPFAAAATQWRGALETLIKLLAPIAPHITEELWHELGHKDSVHVQPWPTWDEQLVREDMVTVVIQVNGKVRANLNMPTDSSETDMQQAAKADERVQKYLAGHKITKTITVPSKLVNFVLK